MEKGALLYEGKAKKVYETNDPDLLWIEYKDSATAFDGKKKATIEGKGRLNNLISSIIFTKLNERGIESHFVQQLSETEQLVKRWRSSPWKP
jgi:phosphoribosylaminoimidazole-succinocarboxamide synthase